MSYHGNVFVAERQDRAVAVTANGTRTLVSPHTFRPKLEKPSECVNCGRREEVHRP